MRLLLDTHAFIWWDDDSSSLSSKARELCENPENTLYLSVASVWEMQIKVQLDKLRFSMPLREKITNQLVQNGLQILPISLIHVYQYGQLELHHRDPFDRLLIAQSFVEKMPLITHDVQFQNYPVKVLW